MKRSDLLIVLAAAALVNPCFFKNKVNTALASSFSAASKFGGTTLKLNDPSITYMAVSIIRKIDYCCSVKTKDENVHTFEFSVYWYGPSDGYIKKTRKGKILPYFALQEKSLRGNESCVLKIYQNKSIC